MKSNSLNLPTKVTPLDNRPTEITSKKLWLLINLESSEPNLQPKIVRTMISVAYLFFLSIAGESYYAIT